jgi:hypothetical protein
VDRAVRADHGRDGRLGQRRLEQGQPLLPPVPGPVVGRRINDAKAALTQAVGTFQRLGVLTDREIGDRLFLSPQTVGSHLYRSYPKLGVGSRHQLRDVIAQTSTSPAKSPSSEVQ